MMSPGTIFSLTLVEGSYFDTTICLRKLEKVRVRANCQHSMPISIDLPQAYMIVIRVETQKNKTRI